MATRNRGKKQTKKIDVVEESKGVPEPVAPAEPVMGFQAAYTHPATEIRQRAEVRVLEATANYAYCESSAKEAAAALERAAKNLQSARDFQLEAERVANQL